MQVLVLAVQNSVDYKYLGVATSGSTLFRQIGGAIGVSIFGAIFSNRLSSELASRLPRGVHLPASANPVAIRQLPAAVHAPYIAAVAASLRPVFLAATGITFLAFLFTWRLREMPLRQTTSPDSVGESIPPPRAETSERELERLAGNLLRRDERRHLYEELLSRAEVHLSPVASWLLGRVAEREPIAIGDLAQQVDVPEDELAAPLAELRADGHVEGDGRLALTSRGREVVERLWTLRRERFLEMLGDWGPDVRHAIDRLADALTQSPPK